MAISLEDAVALGKKSVYQLDSEYVSINEVVQRVSAQDFYAHHHLFIHHWQTPHFIKNILDFLIRMPYGEVGVHYVTYQGRRILVLGYNPIYVTLG